MICLIGDTCQMKDLNTYFTFTDFFHISIHILQNYERYNIFLKSTVTAMIPNENLVVT